VCVCTHTCMNFGVNITSEGLSSDEPSEPPNLVVFSSVYLSIIYMFIKRKKRLYDFIFCFLKYPYARESLLCI